MVHTRRVTRLDPSFIDSREDHMGDPLGDTTSHSSVVPS